MDNKILVPLALLRAALIASKDEDEWDFRNLDAIAINKGHIVATDGCILFYAKLDNVENDKRMDFISTPENGACL